MKQVLHRTVSAIALAICILSYFVPAKGIASEKNKSHRNVFTQAEVLKNIDTVVVAPDFKIIKQVAITSHRFHFIIQKTGSADLASANITADFAIANGFVAAFDAQRVAKLVIEKIKAGTAATITKAELTANRIPQQN
jgi:hypothetical protein